MPVLSLHFPLLRKTKSLHRIRDGVARPPGGDLSLEGAHLRRAIALGMALTQKREQGGSLEGWVALQLLDHPGPILLKGVRSGTPGARAFQFRWQLASPLVLASGSLAHAGLGRCLGLGESFASVLHKQLHLSILLHDTHLLVKV